MSLGNPSIYSSMSLGVVLLVLIMVLVIPLKQLRATSASG
jgi:hypothetical protein